MEKGLHLPQFVAVTDGAANDSALHVTTALVPGYHAITDQKCSGANVISDHFERRCRHIGTGCLAGCSGNQSLEHIDVVVAVYTLQNSCQSLQTHPSVHTRRRQRRYRAIICHVVLHEHVVPNFNKTVTVFVWAAGWATWNVGAVIVKNFRTRAAWTSVGHHPKIVTFVAPALVVPNANHALRRQAYHLRPNVVGLVVVCIHGGQQTLFGKLKHLGQQLPRPQQTLALEIIAKTPVAQHFKKGVVACRVPHIFKVVVFATSTQTSLHRRSAVVTALV